MSFFLPFTTRQLAAAINKSIQKYEDAEDKDEQCNPDVPILILIGKNKYHVLSYGGDPKEEGLILEAMSAKK